MRAAFALVLAAIASAEAPNKSRRLQAGDCADLDGDGVVNVNGAHASFCAGGRVYYVHLNADDAPRPAPAARGLRH